jgi:hypothetical protein
MGWRPDLIGAVEATPSFIWRQIIANKARDCVTVSDPSYSQLLRQIGDSWKMRWRSTRTRCWSLVRCLSPTSSWTPITHAGHAPARSTNRTVFTCSEAAWLDVACLDRARLHLNAPLTAANYTDAVAAIWWITSHQTQTLLWHAAPQKLGRTWV